MKLFLNIIIEQVINTSGRSVINFEHDSVVGSENTSISNAYYVTDT